MLENIDCAILTVPVAANRPSSVSVKTAEGPLQPSALTMAPTALNNYKAKYERNVRNFKPDGRGGEGGGHGSPKIYGPQHAEENADDGYHANN